MRIKIVIAIALFCIPFIADAHKTVLFGTNSTYSGQTINVYSCFDYISGAKQLVGSGLVDSLGNFRIELDIKATCRVTLDLGRACGVLYADTSMNYNIVLPDYRPKTKGDMLNPYFEPDEFLVGIKNPDRYNINMYIDMFDYAYEEQLERNYYMLFRKPAQSAVDSIIGEMEQAFDTVPSDFFKTYRHYKYAWLKFISYMRDWRYMSREYFNNKPVAYDNPAYMDLFNQMFANFLRFYMNTREGERIYSDIVFDKSPMKAKETLSNSLAVTNDTLQEIVLLKGINDAIYDYYFKTSSLQITLDSIKNTTKIDQHKQIAQNIEQKSKAVQLGTHAPDFCLADTAGVFRSVDEYKRKFVYLNFFSLDSYVCAQDLAQLKLLNDKTKEVIEIVSISIDDDFEKVKKYFKRNNYNWTLLDYKGDPTVIERYNVKAYPSYFLIDVDGTLCMSPAASPSENFEQRFQQIFRNRKY